MPEVDDPVTGLLSTAGLPELLTGLVALVMVTYRALWLVLRNVVTIAHEGGHALVALLSGRKLNGIRLHSDTSGLTVSTGRGTGPGMVCTLLAGYPAVSLLGLGGAWLVGEDRVRLMLWIAIGGLALVLVAVRNVYGVLSVLATGGALFALSWYASPVWQGWCAAVLAWFLLFGGIRPLLELQRKRRRRRAPDSDADQLARLTGVAGGAWLALWGLIACAALVLGARFLLLAPTV
ncbi:M50 family metallopeptidase [Salinifilum aidingensis]